MMKAVLFLFALLVVAQASDVVDLTPANFDVIVGGDQPVLVKFVAPWCGHCKSLAPEYEILATAMKNQNVQITSVNADEHASLKNRFAIKGFPTIKYFPAGSTKAEDYSGGRTAVDLLNYVNKEAGTKGRIKTTPTAVEILSPANFDFVVLDPTKAVLVEFFAPWCGHCKKLAPIFEEVAQTYAGEKDIVVASIDCDSHKDLCQKYGVTGYPTLKWFPVVDKAGVAYSAGRTGEAFVEFINKETDSDLVLGGSVLETAGRIEALDALASGFLASSDRAGLLQQTEDMIPTLSQHKNGDFAKFYKITMKRVLSKGPEFLTTEKARLQNMIASGNVTPSKALQFQKRINILQAF